LRVILTAVEALAQRKRFDGCALEGRHRARVRLPMY
jgi:hypothetical protein